MGGKGGGGNDEPGWMPYWRAEQDKIAKQKLADDIAAADAKTKADKAAKDQAAIDKKAADDKAAADKKAADDLDQKAADDKAAADKLALETPIGDPIAAGGAITQPDASGNPVAEAGTGTGDVLGGAVLAPPKYFVGGADSFQSPSTRKSSLKTTDL